MIALAAADPKRKSLFGKYGSLFLLMYFSSLALSFVSGLETYLGLLEFSQKGLVGVVIAAGLTIGVQLLLFVVSWMIAENIREDWRVLAPQVAVWLICAAFSGYFSFFGFFKEQGGASETLRQNAVRSEIVGVFATVDDSMKADIDRRHDAFIASNPPGPLRQWEAESLRDMVRRAVDSRSLLAQAGDARRRELTRKADELKVREDELKRRKVDLELAVAQLAGQIRLKSAEIPDLEGKIGEARSQLATIETEIVGLRAKVDQEAATGKGSRFNAAVRDLNTAESRALEARKRIEGFGASLARATEELQALKIREAANPEAERLRQTEGELVLVGGELAGVAKELDDIGQAGGLQFADAEANFTANLNAVVAGDYRGVDALRQQCIAIRDLLLTTVLADEVRPVRCDSPEAETAVADLRNRVAALDKFRTECREPVIAFEAVASDPRGVQRKVNPEIDRAIGCVARSPDPAQRVDLDSQLRQLVETRGDTAGAMTRAAVSLLADGETNAVLAAIFAAIVDLLVLLCALIGRNVGKSEQVRAIETVLRLLHVDQRDGFEFSLKLPEDRRKAQLVDDIVNLLLREQRAVWEDERRKTLLLRPGAAAYLREIHDGSAGAEYAVRAAQQAPAASSGPRRVRPL